MIVLLLQQSGELLAIHDGLRIPEMPDTTRRVSRSPIAHGSGLTNLFERGVHFDDVGTCYVWHVDSNCYAIPFNIWSHPASPIRERILRHWPHGEQLSFWPQLFEASMPLLADRAQVLGMRERGS